MLKFNSNAETHYSFLKNNKTLFTLMNDKTYTIKRKLGRSCYLVSELSSPEELVFKGEPEVEGALHLVWRFAFGGSLPFQNEFRILKILIQVDGLSFYIPKLRQVCKNSFYLSNYINQLKPIDSSNLQDNIKKKIAVSLADFAKIQRPPKWFFIKEAAFRFLESPFRGFIMDLIKARKKHKINILKVLFIIISLELRRALHRKRIPPGMVHNDMGANNILIDSSDKLYIIDWEDALWVKRWPLIDITDIALKLHSGDLDKHMINYYLYEIRRISGDIPEALLKCHMEFGYLRSLFRALNLQRISEGEKAILANKIKELLNKTDAWDKWWENLRKV